MPVINKKNIKTIEGMEFEIPMRKNYAKMNGKTVAMVGDINIKKSLNMRQVVEDVWVYNSPNVEAELHRIYGSEKFMFANEKFDIVMIDGDSRTVLKDCYASQTSFAICSTPGLMLSEYMKVTVGSIRQEFGDASN